jgi:aminodeoxyfutalosine deaminase
VSAWIKELPKAELHVHLEGSIDAVTLCEIDSTLSRQEAEAGYRYDDFPGFLKAFGFVASRLKKPEDYALAAKRMFMALVGQGVRYVEVTLSAGVVLWKGQDLDAVYEAVRHEGQASAIEVWWNLDAVRQWGPVAAWPVVEFAASRAGDGVVSFGLGGNEMAGPVDWFREHYEYARRQGLRLTCHAGEADGPASVWAALEAGVERIGHGFRAIEDPVLVKHLCDRKIPLEISVTSNVLTRTVPSLAEHPVRRLYDAGVPIAINTDDPALFNVTLIDEYAMLEREFGFGTIDLGILARNGFEYAFRKVAVK